MPHRVFRALRAVRLVQGLGASARSGASDSCQRALLVLVGFCLGRVRASSVGVLSARVVPPVQPLCWLVPLPSALRGVFALRGALVGALRRCSGIVCRRCASAGLLLPLLRACGCVRALLLGALCSLAVCRVWPWSCGCLFASCLGRSARLACSVLFASYSLLLFVSPGFWALTSA